MKDPVNLNDYDVIPQEASAAATIINDMFIRLGRPSDPFSPSGEKMLTILISIWEDLYPKELKQWIATKKEYQIAELSTREQVHKHTGRSLASIPTPLYKLMKEVFPDFKMNNREDFMKLCRKYPYFKMANKL